MSALDLAVVGMGLVSPTGLTPRDHAFFVRAGCGLSGPQAFSDELGEPVKAAHCAWLGAELGLVERMVSMSERAVASALAPVASAPGLRGVRLPAILICAASWSEFSEQEAAEVEARLQQRQPLRVGVRATGEAGFFYGLVVARQWLQSGEAPAVVLVATDSVISPAALGACSREFTPWQRVQAPLAEGAAAMVVMQPAEAAARGLELLGTLRAGGTALGKANDDNDEIVDGDAMTGLLREAAGLGEPITQAFGQHNVDSLRHLEFNYSVSRNASAFAPECRLECVEDDIGRVGAAAGAVHLVYGLATELHQTAPFGGGGLLLCWAISRDGTRGLCIAKGASHG